MVEIILGGLAVVVVGWCVFSIWSMFTEPEEDRFANHYHDVLRGMVERQVNLVKRIEALENQNVAKKVATKKRAR